MLINVSPKSLLSAGAHIVIVVPTLGLRQPSLSDRTIINFVIFIVITIVTIIAIIIIISTVMPSSLAPRYLFSQAKP